MATMMRQHLMAALGSLRYEPTTKMVTVSSADQVVARTEQAILVWEPHRIVPSYAVPVADLLLPLEDVRPFAVETTPTGLLDPSNDFAQHTCAGRTAIVRGEAGPGEAFLPDELDGYAVLDFTAFDWFEEDERIFGHPRDPFSRIDIRHSARVVHMVSGGDILAESGHPLMLFETHLPPRFYLSPGDVLADLVRSDTSTTCAYKGEATHWSAPGLGDAGIDIAWSYENPPPEMHQITGRICFYQEKVDFVIDGVRSERPQTPWSQ